MWHQMECLVRQALTSFAIVMSHKADSTVYMSLCTGRERSSPHAMLCCRRNRRIINTTQYGVFVEVLPGVRGMVHISQLDTKRTNTDDFPEGMAIDVKVIDVRRPAHGMV